MIERKKARESAAKEGAKLEKVYPRDEDKAPLPVRSHPRQLRQSTKDSRQCGTTWKEERKEGRKRKEG